MTLWGYRYLLSKYCKDITPILENQMEKKIENEMETGVIWVVSLNVHIGTHWDNIGGILGLCWDNREKEWKLLFRV